MVRWLGWSLQDLASSEWLLEYNSVIVGGILISVLIFMALSIFSPWSFTLKESWLMESVWMILPTILSFLLVIPTLHILYVEGNEEESAVSLKSSGHQWYWTYDYSPFEKSFDSFLKSESTLRLLESDSVVVLPFSTPVKMSTTSEDVLHCWALPPLDVKMDSNPGRLNSTILFSSFPGKMFGQCSEICGANHSFMPIDVEFVSMSMFSSWLMMT